jgi:uncharacterized membrane protein
MLSRVRNVMILLRGQMWLIPAIMMALGLALAYVLVNHGLLFRTIEDTDLWWVYGGDASSARDLYSSLLTGLITMTSLVVSITFVILTLAANQLGPRLIATFMADRQIQLVIGLFLSTILYVLIVLRTLEDELGRDDVPHIAVTVGSGLTIICLITLLFYLHKIARSILADNVIEMAANDLSRNARDILPSELGGAQDAFPPPEVHGGTSVSLGRSGYIQTIDYEKLVELARKNDFVLKIDVRAGHFVLKRGDHVRVHHDAEPDQEILKRIRKAFVIGETRTPAQDLEYGIHQLVEIALRALSPSINDPFTAIVVINRLGAALENILARQPLPCVLRDKDGEIRVIATRLNEGAVDAAFDLIREAGAGQPLILLRIADVLKQLAPVLHMDASRDAVLVQLEKLAATARKTAFAEHDQQRVMQRINAARAIVEQRSGIGLGEP